MNSPYRQLALVLWGALAWPAGARAATTIDGGDIGGQVWTAAGSPYIVGKVNGDPTVPAGQELRIEAGATVLFSGPEDMTLRVQGTLNVNGTATAPVILQAQLGDPAIAWYGIDVLSSSAVVRITGAVIRNAMYGLKIWAGDARVDRTTFESCRLGLSVSKNENSYVFDSLAFHKNSVGFECYFCGAVKLTNMVAQGTVSHAVVLYGTGAVTIINSTLDGNGRGVDIWPDPTGPAAVTTLDLVNTILSNNRLAIELDLRFGPAVLTATHSTFWGNPDANLRVKPAGGSSSSFVITAGSVAPTGVGNVVADPKYLSATDLHLSASSPCIDSGTTGGPNHDFDQSRRPIEGDGEADTDGSTFDRGAYEFGATGGTGSGGSGAAGGGGGSSGAAGGGGGSSGASEGGGGASGAAGGGGAAGGAGGRGGEGGGAGEAAGREGMGGRLGGGSGGGAGMGNNGQTGGIASAGDDAGVDAPTSTGGEAGSVATPDAAADRHPTVKGAGCGCRLVAGSEGATGTVLALALLGIVLGRRGRRH